MSWVRNPLGVPLSEVLCTGKWTDSEQNRKNLIHRSNPADEVFSFLGGERDWCHQSHLSCPSLSYTSDTVRGRGLYWTCLLLLSSQTILTTFVPYRLQSASPQRILSILEGLTMEQYQVSSYGFLQKHRIGQLRSNFFFRHLAALVALRMHIRQSYLWCTALRFLAFESLFQNVLQSSPCLYPQSLGSCCFWGKVSFSLFLA